MDSQCRDKFRGALGFLSDADFPPCEARDRVDERAWKNRHRDSPLAAQSSGPRRDAQKVSAEVFSKLSPVRRRRTLPATRKKGAPLSGGMFSTASRSNCESKNMLGCDVAMRLSHNLPGHRTIQFSKRPEIVTAPRKEVCRKCAVRFDPICARLSLFNTSSKCFRAGLS